MSRSPHYESSWVQGEKVESHAGWKRWDDEYGLLITKTRAIDDGSMWSTSLHHSLLNFTGAAGGTIFAAKWNRIAGTSSSPHRLIAFWLLLSCSLQRFFFSGMELLAKNCMPSLFTEGLAAKKERFCKMLKCRLALSLHSLFIPFTLFIHFASEWMFLHSNMSCRLHTNGTFSLYCNQLEDSYIFFTLYSGYV